MSADVSELQVLAADLGRAGAAVTEQARRVVSRGALNIKRDWRTNAQATAGAHARRYPYSIGYDPVVLPGGGVGAIIGPDKGAVQGALGNLLEYGSVHNPPHNDGGRALLAEAPRFLAAVEQLGGELL